MKARGLGDLICAVPYLLGFRPAESLVVIGLEAGSVAVTIRLDLDHARADPSAVCQSLATMQRGGASKFMILIFDEHAVPGLGPLPWGELVADVAGEIDFVGGDPADAVLVAGGRYWSYRCFGAGCCPDDGTVIEEASSRIPAQATFAGLVALPDREAFSNLLAPHPEAEREQLRPAIDQAWDHAMGMLAAGREATVNRSDVRALFAAQRRVQAEVHERPVHVDLSPAAIARFGVALRRVEVRDAVWMAMDDGRLPGDELWRHLGRALPEPYDAAPMFLVGWAAWRDGNGASAHIAAERALSSDPGYSAADLLVAALRNAIDPRTFPRLRRSARRCGPRRADRG